MTLETGNVVSRASDLTSSGSLAPDGGPENRYEGRWLSILWPLAILFHLAGNGGHLLALTSVGMLQLGLVILAGWTLVQPRPAVAAGLAALYLTVLWIKMPVVGNHEIILGLFSATVIPAAAVGRGRWPVLVAQPGRAILVVAYGTIAVSKLNTGFFDLVGSCAVLFADEFGAIVGAAPSNSSVLSAAIIAVTAGTEVSIPILLMIRRFRLYGVGLALAFHFVLALDPVSHIWDFSAVLLPLFLLFMPVGFHRQLDRSLASVDRRPEGERTLAVAVIIGLAGIAMAGGLPFSAPTWSVAFPAWLAVSGLVLVHYWRFGVAQGFGRRQTTTESQLLNGWEPKTVVRLSTLLIVAVAVLNGLSPYLEVRSAAAFNMYSNLRVIDGDSNHLLINSLRSNDRAYAEMVDVAQDSSLEFYLDNRLALPVETLDRYLSDHPAENPVINLGQGPVAARAAGYGSAQATGVGGGVADVFVRKLAVRRAVPLEALHGGQPRCLRAWGPIG